MRRLGLKDIFQYIKNIIKRVRDAIKTFPYFGNGKVCPICGKYFHAFRIYGKFPNVDLQCPICYSFSRHRLLYIFLMKKTDFFERLEKKFLHVSPNYCFQAKFKKIFSEGYLSTYLSDSEAMVKMDITDIDYQDKYFDIIFCNHVLEHIKDDKKALSELYRVLKDDGWAILIVPISTDKTFEDASIVDSAERLQVFGQKDHVRLCGKDYIDRFREAGFKVETIRAKDLLKKDEAVEMGIEMAAGEIYYCTKGI